MLAADTAFHQDGASTGDTCIPTTRLTTRLTKDDPGAMEIVMDAIHLRGERVPRKVDFEQLCGLARICEKFDMDQSLGVWGDTWLQPFIEDMDAVNKGQLLWIAITFRSTNWFPTINRHIILTTSIGDAPELKLFSGESGYVIPSSIIGKFYWLVITNVHVINVV